MTDPIPLSAAFRRMRATFEDERRWTKGAWSRASQESPSLSGGREREATCWCVLGLFMTQPITIPNFDQGLAIMRTLIGGSIQCWQDAAIRTIADVRNLLDRAIVHVVAIERGAEREIAAP